MEQAKPSLAICRARWLACCPGERLWTWSAPRSWWKLPSRSLCQAAVSMEAATAQAAFFGPRRWRGRWNCARRWPSFLRLAAQAHWTRAVFSQGAPWRNRVERRLPALSSLRGHRPAQETRWAAVGKRPMSVPISATMARAARSPMTGTVRSRRTASRNGSRPRSFEAVLRSGVDLLERLRQRVVLAQVQAEQEAVSLV